MLYFRTSLEVKCKIYSCALKPRSTDFLGHQQCAISICAVLVAQRIHATGSLHFHTLKVRILKVLTHCQSVKVKQCYQSYIITCACPTLYHTVHIASKYIVQFQALRCTLVFWKKLSCNTTRVHTEAYFDDKDVCK